VAAVAVLACTAPAELDPGTYVCHPTNPTFFHIEPIRFDSETADARASWPITDTIYVTTTEGKRVALSTDDIVRWECKREGDT
jgi:hypothetical protein